MPEFSFVRKKVLEGDVTSSFMINITSLCKVTLKIFNHEIVSVRCLSQIRKNVLFFVQKAAQK
jgi:hypothetical protein